MLKTLLCPTTNLTTKRSSFYVYPILKTCQVYILIRKNKEVGLVREINALLVEMMAGDEHFEMGTLLRNSCLVSSMMFNCEAWYGLTLKQIKLLEKEDES